MRDGVGKEVNEAATSTVGAATQDGSCALAEPAVDGMLRWSEDVTCLRLTSCDGSALSCVRFVCCCCWLLRGVLLLFRL